HGDAVTAVALSADGSQVLTGGADRLVRVSTFANGQQQRQLAGPAAAVACVAPSGNGQLVAGGTQDGRLFVWTADGKALVGTLAHAGAVTGVSFNPGGGQVLTSGRDGLVKLWSLPPGPARTLTHPDAVLASFLTPDG